MKLTIKQGDTRHAIRAALKTVEGTPVDLSSASVRFKMSQRFGTIALDREATIEPDGTVHYVFNDGETDVSGFYKAEFLVTYADAREETFPHDGTIEIHIKNRIGGV